MKYKILILYICVCIYLYILRCPREKNSFGFLLYVVAICGLSQLALTYGLKLLC